MSHEVHWCPNCEHGTELEPTDTTAEVIMTAADVQIAKIQADRDIALAKIQARIYTEELQVGVAVAEAENEILSDVVEDLTAPDENVTVIASDGLPDAEEDQGDEPIAEAPPEAEFEPPAPAKKSSLSYWG